MPKTNSDLRFSEDTVCDRCGKFGAFRFDDIALCEECYEGAGSCCLEFGGDDLWLTREEDQPLISGQSPNEP